MTNKMTELVRKREPILIKVAHSWSMLCASSMIVQRIGKHFSAFNRKAPFSPAFVNNGGTWNGYDCAVNLRDGTFGTGLLSSVVETAEREGFSVELEDLRGDAPFCNQSPWVWTGHELRQEQVECITRMKEHGMGIVQLPTGSGKTALLLKYVQEMGLPAIITVPTEDLMRQTVDRACTYIKGIRVGMLGAGKVCGDDCDLVVATQKTLMNLVQGAGKTDFIEWAARFDILISDECHKIVSTDSVTKTWQMIMCIPAYYRFGVSATPFEEKNTLAELYLRQAYGPVLYAKTMQETVEAGYVVGFDVMYIRPEYPDGFTLNPLEGQSWQEAHEEFIVNNHLRNQIIVDTTAELVRDAGHKVLVVAQRILHNDMLYQALRAALEPTYHVYQLHGKTKRREYILDTYTRTKKPCVLVASSIANDGLDIPDIASIIVAHGGKSFFQVIQRVGRGLRLAQDKDRLILIDFDDSALGKWFRNHAQERKKLYKGLGGTIHNIV